MPSDDLTKWITSEVDFYTLLGITPESFTAEELRRAYRKTALRYHPDKLGAAFDADKYEQFQAANDVLADPELKQKYDNYRNARVQKQKAAALFEGKRRTMKEELEARERGGSLGKRSREDEELTAEMRRLAEEGRKRRATRESMMSKNEPLPAKAQKEEREAPAKAQEEEHEDEVARLERLIAEAAAAKAARKANKKARKSTGADFKIDSKSTATSTPISTPTPKFSFSSPNMGNKAERGGDWAATMAKLKGSG